MLPPTRGSKTISASGASMMTAVVPCRLARDAASAIAELCIRFGDESETGALYDAASLALESIAAAARSDVTTAGLAYLGQARGSARNCMT